MTDDPLVFENRAAFRKWLVKNHQNSPGIWLVFGKGGKVKTLSAHEALEEALCFGWIDGRLQSLGAETYRKRFTPRRKGSVWSERNRKLAQKLIEEGAMTAAGHAAIARAQEGGTWAEGGTVTYFWHSRGDRRGAATMSSGSRWGLRLGLDQLRLNLGP